MNIQQLRTDETSKVNHLISDFARDVNVEGKHVVDTEQLGSMARRHFDDVAFGLSLFMMLFLIASVVAIAAYTVS
jgi:hypothetical protein